MNTIEQVKTTAEKKTQTVSALVESQGFIRKDVAPYLAESFGICSKEDYKKAGKNNAKYNIDIEKEFKSRLKNGKEILPLSNQVNKFTGAKKDIVNKLLYGENSKNKGFAGYVDRLDTKQIASLNDMSDENFRGFIYQEATKVKEIGGGVSGPNIDGLKGIMGISKFEESFNKFQSNPKCKNIQWIKAKEVDIWYTNLNKEEKQKLLQQHESIDTVKRNYTLANNLKIASNSGVINQLTPEEQTEFNQMMVEYYAYNESIGFGDELREIWGDELYMKVHTLSTNEIYEMKEGDITGIDSIKNEIVSDKNITSYFKKNQIKDLVKEENKDEKYYENLRKLYPEVDKLIEKDKGIQKLIKKEKKTDQEKKLLEQKIQEKTKLSEKNLQADTNEIVQEQAVTTCLDTLKLYMDINLTDEENVLAQFTRVEQEDLIKKEKGDVVLNIDGMINGKKIKVYYNLTKGTLQQEEFLAKDGANAPFSINDPVGGKKDVIGVQLPKFEDFLTGAKNIDYKKAIAISANVESYKKNISTELKQYVKKEGVRDIDTEKNIFQKTVFQNIVAQEIFEFMGKDKNMTEIFPQNKNAEIYSMYSLLYNTLHYYTIDELKTLRTNILKLKVYKEKYISNIEEKGNNEEKYLLGLLGNETALSNRATDKKDSYTLLNSYASFFSICKVTEANIPIIDLNMFEKFTSNAESEVSRDQSYLDGKDRQDKFKQAISEMEINNQLADLEKDIENLPEMKKSL